MGLEMTKPLLSLFVFVLLVFSSSMIFFKHIETAWSSDWVCTKQHEILGSPSGPLFEYQIKLILHYGSGTDTGEDIYCDSKCRGDFGDIRFTDSSDNILDYWIEKKTDFEKASIWCEVPYIPAYPETTSIFIQYGNPDATTTSNGETTFPIFDDFEDGLFNTILWEDISHGSGSVSESNGVLQLNSPTAPNSTAQIRSKASFTGKCAVHTKWRFKTQSSIGGAGIIRVSDAISSTQEIEDLGLEFWWGGISWAQNKFMLLERDVARTFLDTTPLHNQFYDIRMKVLEASAKVELAGIEEASISSTHDYTDTETLEIGLRSNCWVDSPEARITEYDYVFLRKLSSLEPTHGETLLVSDTIIVDQTQVSADTAYLGHPQTIRFHVVWNTGSPIDEGYIVVNSSSYTLNSSGWATIPYDASSVGSKTWAVTSVEVNDNPNYYSQIVSNPCITFFDHIHTEYHVETGALGIFQVTATLSSETNAVPLSDAVVTINGVPADEADSGKYQVELSSWLPFLSITITAEKQYFDPINNTIIGFSTSNILLESTVIIVSVLAVSRFNRLWAGRKKQSFNLNKLEKLVKERGQIQLKEAARQLGLDLAEVKTLLQSLLRTKRITGTFTVDGLSFITEDALRDDILEGIE